MLTLGCVSFQYLLDTAVSDIKFRQYFRSDFANFTNIFAQILRNGYSELTNIAGSNIC